jgi:hypothetical protein
MLSFKNFIQEARNRGGSRGPKGNSVSAVRLKDGTIFSGESHYQAINAAHYHLFPDGHSNPEDPEKFIQSFYSSKEHGERGYVSPAPLRHGKYTEKKHHFVSTDELRKWDDLKEHELMEIAHNINYDLSLPDNENDFRNSRWSKKKEAAMTFNSKGDITHTVVGKNNKVIHPPEHLNVIKGGHYIHNHPNGSNVSPTDFIFAHHTNLKSIEAFGISPTTGKKTKWIATPHPENGWPHPMLVKASLRNIKPLRVMQARQKIKSGEMLPNHAVDWATNQICQDVADRHGIKIQKIEE